MLCRKHKKLFHGTSCITLLSGQGNRAQDGAIDDPGCPASGAGLGHHAIPRPLSYMQMGTALGRHWRASLTRRVAAHIAMMSNFASPPLPTPSCGRHGHRQRPASVPIPHRFLLSPKVPRVFSPPTAIQSALEAAARISCRWLLLGPGALLHSALLLASAEHRDNIRTHQLPGPSPVRPQSGPGL